MSQQVLGIGGIFIRSKNPDALNAWYRDMFGITPAADHTPTGDNGIAGAVLGGCVPTAPVDAATAAPVVMVGPLERSEVQQRLPEWTSDAELDVEAVRGLASVTPGAEVTVIFGTWCSDSRRDVPRLWRAFDAAGALPFSVKFFGLDRAKTAPGFDKSGNDLQYVPTIVVKREGREVGRIVESTREPIERELWMLLQGKKNGLITARTDLGPSS